MSEPSIPAEPELFREQAVQAFARQRRGGQLLQISPVWASWAVWILVATLAGLFVFVATVHIDTWTTGPAEVREGEFGTEVVALFPAADHERLESGQPGFARFPGVARPIGLRVRDVADTLASPAELAGGLARAPDIDANTPAAVVHATIPSENSVPAGATGTLDVRIGRRTLLSALLPQDSP